MTTITPDPMHHDLRAPPIGASLGTSARAVAQRTARKYFRTPQLVVSNTIQSAMFLFIFRYVFGGAIDTDGIPYVDFLVPGFVTTTVLFVGASTAVGVAGDLEQGFVDRLRSLPIPRASVLVGRAVADTGMLAWSLTVTVALGFAVGFRLHDSLAAGLAALALSLLFGFAFTWVFITIGLIAGNTQAAQGISLLVFPFTFISSAYVPAESMPGWLQPFAEHQPVTTTVDAVRGLSLGQPAGADVVTALLWCLGLIVVFGTLATARFRHS
jgi:ABC-2 type transport system permease protein